MIEFLNAIRDIVALNRALYLVANNKDVLAFKLLETRPKSSKSFEVISRILLLKGYLAVSADRDSEARVLLLGAIDLIRRARMFSDGEKAYLLAYARRFLELCAGSSEAGELEELPTFKVVNLDQVSTTIRQQFPLRLHPNWQRGK